MKTIYTLLILSILLIIALLIASFVYLEKTSHENLYYIVNSNRAEIGDIEIDKYITEKNIIYKSKVNLPYEIGPNKKETRIELDKKTGRLKDYEEIDLKGDIKELLYLKKEGDQLNFLAVAKSKFAYLDNIKIEKDALFFDYQNLVTLIPFVKLYNFKRGGSQSFNTLKYDITLLPPSRYVITLSSIRDEYINVDNKKIKTECLKLKAEGIKEIFIWVDKRKHNIIALDFSDEQIYIKKALWVRETNFY